MKATEKAYIAGIIDGEGWMGFVSDGYGRKDRPQIEVESTDRELVEWLKAVAGGYNPKPRTPRKENWSVTYRWRIGGPKCRRLLVEVLPYLVMERRRSKAMELIAGSPATENA